MKMGSNDLSLTLKALSPYRETLQGITVESTFNWYWLVDGLQEHGYDFRLVNTLAVKQYDGLKYSGDRYDSFHLARLMWLAIRTGRGRRYRPAARRLDFEAGLDPGFVDPARPPGYRHRQRMDLGENPPRHHLIPAGNHVSLD
jgi:hypothetical protein